MKRYLIVKHFYKGTYQTDTITVEDLAKAKQGDMEQIIDLQNTTWFDPKTNAWIDIKEGLRNN